MRSRDICIDVAAIVNPFPQRPPGEEGWRDVEEYHAVAEDREITVDELRTAWEEGDQDPLLAALWAARRAKERAEDSIRHLLTYGREFVQPRPYTLADLATAAGMSISGVRTAYQDDDVEAVAQITGAKSRDWRTPRRPERTTRDDQRSMLPTFKAAPAAARRHRGQTPPG